VALRGHWFHLKQETGSGVMFGNLTVSFGKSQIGSAAIPIRAACCQGRPHILWNPVRRRVYTWSDCLLGELAGWSPWNLV
ncbi:hypothetical protein B9Z19DRAFT_1013250, partial [Tuber borchii]